MLVGSYEDGRTGFNLNSYKLPITHYQFPLAIKSAPIKKQPLRNGKIIPDTLLLLKKA